MKWLPAFLFVIAAFFLYALTKSIVVTFLVTLLITVIFAIVAMIIIAKSGGPGIDLDNELDDEPNDKKQGRN